MIVLLNPPGSSFHARSSRWGGAKNRSGILAPPLFLAQAAGFLREQGIEARVVDAAALQLTTDDLHKIFLADKVEMVVLEVSTASIKSDGEIARLLKERYGCPIVMVGSHPTALPEETLRCYPVNFVCIGEYEVTLLDLYRSVIKGQNSADTVKGISFLQDKKVVVTPQRPLLNLDSLPPPAYDQLPITRYYDPIGRNHPYMAIRTSRGCPFKCKFCVTPRLFYNYKVRFHSPRKVVDEMELLKKEQGVREIMIDDATFTLNREHVYCICDELKKRKLKIDWSCFGRSDLVDHELLSRMREAGCYLVRYGVESVDDNVLSSMEKGLRVSDIQRSLEITKKEGMRTHVTVMFGFPGETRESIERTVDFVKQPLVDFAQFSIATPYPGTVFFEEMESRGKLLTHDWADYDGTCRVVVEHDTFSADELIQAVERGYREFYFRPQYLWRRLRSLRSGNEIRCQLRSAFYLIRSQFT